jgi:hypothetical protein
MTVCYSIIEPFSLTPLNTTDITYKSLAKSFNQNLAHHQETIRRMNAMNKNRKWVGSQNPEQLAATHRMALFPESAEVLYVEKDIWVVCKHPCSSSGMQPLSRLFPLARGTTRREIMRLSRNISLIPEDVAWTHALSFTSPKA